MILNTAGGGGGGGGGGGAPLPIIILLVGASYVPPLFSKAASQELMLSREITGFLLAISAACSSGDKASNLRLSYFFYNSAIMVININLKILIK